MEASIGKLIEQQREIESPRAELESCNEFLKDGETVYERMVRFHKDLVQEIGVHAKLKLELEAARLFHERENQAEELLAVKHERDELVEALELISWCNDTKWQADRAKQALAKVGKGETK